MKFSIFFFLIFLIFATPHNTYSQSIASQDDLTKMVLNSNSRVIFELNGYWDTELSDGTTGSFYLPKVFYNCDKATFKKTIHIDRKLLTNSVWHFYFLGLNDEIEIYWNSQFIGKFISDGTPLWVSIPKKFIVKETNEITLIINPSQSLSYLVKQNYQYYPKIVTGISRDFFLVRTSPVFINSFSYSLTFESLSKVELKARLNISSFEIESFLKAQNLTDQNHHIFKFELYLRNKETNQIITQTQPQVISISSFRNIFIESSLTLLNPTLWEPENPYLYSLEVRISLGDTLIDDITYDLGITKWENVGYKKGISWLINGKPFTLKAVDFIEVYDNYNTGQKLKKFESDLKNLKSLGANAVRVLFSSPNPILLKLANRYGLIVLVDLPVYYIPPSLLKKSDLFIRFQIISENISKFCGPNPSFFALGLGEGLDVSSNIIKDYFEKLSNRINHYGKIYTYASFLAGQNLQNIETLDFIIVKDNFKFKKKQDQLLTILTRYTDVVKKPIVFSFGTITNPNNHNGYNNPLSVEYQAFYILEKFNLQNRAGFSGVIVWSYNDYFTENPLLKSASIEPYISFSGIQDYNQQRLAFNVLKSLFNNEEIPIINPGLPEFQLNVPYIVSGILAVLIWSIMLNRSKRFREYTFRSAFRTYNFFADIRDKRIISELQTAFFGLVLSLIIGTYISSIITFYKTFDEFQFLVSLFIPSFFIREWLFKLAWNPVLAIIIFSIISYFKLFLLAVLLKITSFFVRSKIFFDDTFKMVIWASQPIVLILPIAIFINRILPISSIIAYLFHIFFALVILWCFQRIIKSVWVVFDIRPTKAYFWAFAFVFVILFIYFGIQEYLFNFFDYIICFTKIIL